MSKELEHSKVGRNQIRTRPTVYKCTKDGNVDRWLLLMRQFFERVHAKSAERAKTWAIIDHLEGDSRTYIINKSELERNNPERFSASLLADLEPAATRRISGKPSYHLSSRRKKIECNTWMPLKD